jgi:hypothetical protein
METLLGLFGVAIWIVAVIALAAAVTFTVIKLTPGEKKPETG